MKNDVGFAPEEGRVLPTYLDKLLGVRVLLIHSALEVEHDGMAAVIVPDLQGLEAAVAVARATVSDKLSGKEIRFLRKAIGMKEGELARFLDVAAETISRWENGREIISTNAERVFRIKVLTDLREKAVGVEAKLNTVVEMKFSPFRASVSPTTLIFERVGAVVAGRREKIWLYQGVADEHHWLRRCGVDQLADCPDMIGDPHCHRRGDLQGFMESRSTCKRKRLHSAA